MTENSVVFLGDRFLAPGEAPKVSLFDRGYLLGDSVFASLRVEDGHPFALYMHIARFLEAASGVGIEVPNASTITTIVAQACARFGQTQGYLRLTASRGEGGAGLAVSNVGPPLFSVVLRPLESAPFPPPTPVRVATLRAMPAECLDPSWKVGSYAARVQMRREAEEHGHREALVLGVSGELVSGIASNVFVLEGGVFRTPRLAVGARPGVTREVCLGLLGRLGFSAVETVVTMDHVRRADAVFFTSTLLPILVCSEVCGIGVGVDRPEVAALRHAYVDAVARDRKKTASLKRPSEDG